MSISSNSSDQTNGPYTSKQTATIQSKLFYTHSIQMTKQITEKPKMASFWTQTKFAFKTRSRRPENLNRIRLLSNSKRKGPNQRRKCLRKNEVHKKFQVNVFFVYYTQLFQKDIKKLK
jgi:hypothetical protein